ncbi:unnamed protein product [marine sediment metagenome]|uniref:Uncharacterized protein n=1 Tax=marine sediment metagenome TaxID=412755 RepID=X1ACR7_9ZZZZ
MVNLQTIRKALRVFKQRKVMSIVQLVKVLNYSVPTVRNRLKEWNTFTSYNKNGSYYALPSVPEFDKHGLWKYKSVFFSKHGNMKKTIINLVKTSETGLDASQVGKLLGLIPRSFTSHLKALPSLCREKYEGRYVYFSSKKEVHLLQKKKREEELEEKKRILPSDADAIIILVDCIKHPDSSAEECALRLRKKAKHISAEAIRTLFEYHGIEKKTPDMPS